MMDSSAKQELPGIPGAETQKVKKMAKNDDSMFISIDEVEVAPRGRKAQWDDELLDLLGKLKKDQAVRLTDKQVEPTDDEKAQTAERAKVSAVIRKHFRKAHNGQNCRIDYTSDGIPQVRFSTR